MGHEPVLNLADDLLETRLQSALALNREFLLFYWRTGAKLVEFRRRNQERAGASLLRRFRNHLTRQQANVEGLAQVERFAEAWTEEEAGSVPHCLLTWDHHRQLLARHGDSRELLLECIREYALQG